MSGALALSAAAMPEFGFGGDDLPGDGRVALYMGADGSLSALGQALDERTGGRISDAIAAMELEGEFGETVSLPGVAPYRHIAVISKGTEPLTARRLHDLGGHAAKAADDHEGLAILSDGLGEVENAAAHIAPGHALGDYRFTAYKTVEEISEDGEVTLIGSSRQQAGSPPQSAAVPVSASPVVSGSYFANQPMMLSTLALRREGREAMEWEAPGMRMRAVSTPCILSAV